MKIFKIIKKDLIPINQRQQLALLIIIASIFQFVLFYAPALADEVIKNTQIKNSVELINSNKLIINDSIDRNTNPNKNINKIIGPNNLIGPSINSNSTKRSNINRTKVKNNNKKTKTIRTSIHIITAYNSEVAQTDNDPCITANGFNICKHNQEDTIAANFLKFGTKVKIPSLFGERIFIVRDRMNKKNNDRIDVWMRKKSNALKFGKRIARIEIVQ